ncbi:hypothetical protein ONZ45_g1660 [Pleurotus djamor]|nr:hypothetical protein ONZ45_g1660 [Pleurotus djamor]
MSNTTLPPALVPLAQEIDAKTDASFAQMWRMREERNRVCCATRNLPAELLSMTFALLMWDESDILHFDEFSMRCFADDGEPTWLVVTHVCRQWRLAALSDPSLWSDLTCVKGKWLERFIALSKASPLTFKYDGTPSDSLKESFLDLPERLGEVYITECTDKILGRLNKPTPFLTSLSLRGVLHWFQHDYVSIPDDFLAGSAPMLRTFYLSHCKIPLRPSWLCNVNTLMLNGRWEILSASGQRAQLTTASFLDFIKPLQELAVLHVDLHHECADHTYTGPIIHFAHLEFLDLDLVEGLLSSVELLKHIKTPSLVDMEVAWPLDMIDFMDTAAAVNDSSDAMALIHQFFTKNTGLPLTKLEWMISQVGSNITLSSSNPARSLTLYNVVTSAENIPFVNLESIKTVVIACSEVLMILDASPLKPWPMSDRVKIPV